MFFNNFKFRVLHENGLVQLRGVSRNGHDLGGDTITLTFDEVRGLANLLTAPSEVWCPALDLSKLPKSDEDHRG